MSYNKYITKGALIALAGLHEAGGLKLQMEDPDKAPTFPPPPPPFGLEPEQDLLLAPLAFRDGAEKSVEAAAFHSEQFQKATVARYLMVHRQPQREGSPNHLEMTCIKIDGVTVTADNYRGLFVKMSSIFDEEHHGPDKLTDGNYNTYIKTHAPRPAEGVVNEECKAGGPGNINAPWLFIDFGREVRSKWSSQSILNYN